MNLRGQRSVIYPALLWDSDGATLADRPALSGPLSQASLSQLSSTPLDVFVSWCHCCGRLKALRRVPVSSENQCIEAPSRERSFGKVVKGWANNISRCQALKLVGAAILSATLIPLFSRRSLAPAQSGYNWWG